jgi:hypothetical protein
MARLVAAGLCLLVALGLTGCGGDDARLPIAGDETAVDAAAVPLTAKYMPLQAGNWWKYRQTGWTKGEGSATTTYTLKIKGVETLEGKKWYRSRYIAADGQASDYNWYRHLASGLWMRDNSYYYDWFLLKAPAESGMQWDRRTGNHSIIANANATTTVPAGTFSNCVMVETNWSYGESKYKYRDWYAPGVGVVKALVEQRFGDPSTLKYSRTEWLQKTNVVPTG